jgi:hypothetical protein
MTSTSRTAPACGPAPRCWLLPTRLPDSAARRHAAMLSGSGPHQPSCPSCEPAENLKITSPTAAPPRCLAPGRYPFGADSRPRGRRTAGDAGLWILPKLLTGSWRAPVRLLCPKRPHIRPASRGLCMISSVWWSPFRPVFPSIVQRSATG